MASTVMVIAKYKEDISWTSSVKIPLKIYDKSDGSIPNVGREAETYIRYIVEHYNEPNFPDFVVFVQGNPWDHAGNSQEKTMQMIYDTEKLSTDKITSLSGFYLTEQHNAYGTKGPEGYRFYFKGDVPSMFEFSCGAQYIVPKKCIFHRPKSFYEAIWRAMHNRDISHPIYNACVVDAWTMERLWPYIFNIHIPHNNFTEIPLGI